MRVLATQEFAGFAPITVALSIESREELNAIYQLANYNNAVSQVLIERCHLCGDTAPEQARQFLESLYEALSAYHTRHC